LATVLHGATAGGVDPGGADADRSRCGEALAAAASGRDSRSEESGSAAIAGPGEALSRLPADVAGNQVHWPTALEQGRINPRTNIFPETKVRVLDTDILLNLRGGTPIVRFPHRQHTLWLDCSNCHEQLFKSKAGANKFSMQLILQGEQCGVCHGAVAFPLTQCGRCHNTSRKQPLPAGAVPGS
jgi:c(7)-type cytochrome triheme protein